MQTKPKMSKRITIFAAGALLLLSVLLVVPSTSEAIFGALGIDTGKTYYNDFKPFTPYVPGYFPDDFDIIYVDNDAQLSKEVDTYTETYASAEYFFKLVESQGEGVPTLSPDPDFTIQGAPASLTSGFDAALFAADTLELNTYDTSQVLVITVVLREINIQIVTNLSQEEAVRVAEGLVPAICTTKPTETAN
ncbi:hypothetical protein KQH61_04715 [bacterium]|nr:hypothetical protein [bacterium]MCB2179204.1 hypothetical protein [bacterium]